MLTVTFPKRERPNPVGSWSSSMIEDDQEGAMKHSVKAAILLLAGFIGLDIWTGCGWFNESVQIMGGIFFSDKTLSFTETRG
jgi:hypothetical protein